MKWVILVNQKAIFEKKLNIKGTSLETWALLDFLYFLNKAPKLRRCTFEGEDYIWINYKYIIKHMPLCVFNNRNIKKHLDFLKILGLIKLHKEPDNTMFFKITELADTIMNMTFDINMDEYDDDFDKLASAELHKPSAELHKPSAELHKPSAELHKHKNIKNKLEKKNNKEEFEKEKIKKEKVGDFFDKKSPSLFSNEIDKNEIVKDEVKVSEVKNDKPNNLKLSKEDIHLRELGLTKIPKTKDEILIYADKIYKKFSDEGKVSSEYLTNDDFIEWVNYKLNRDKGKVTYNTIRLNLNKLISLGFNARQSIDNSINSGWSGLFEVKSFGNNKKPEIDYSMMFQSTLDGDEPEGFLEGMYMDDETAKFFGVKRYKRYEDED